LPFSDVGEMTIGPKYLKMLWTIRLFWRIVIWRPETMSLKLVRLFSSGWQTLRFRRNRWRSRRNHTNVQRNYLRRRISALPGTTLFFVWTRWSNVL